MTLCHELVHLRRGDLRLGLGAGPGAQDLLLPSVGGPGRREYAIAREAACDAEVLRVLGSAPQAYGRLLLRWGVAPRETGLDAAGASPSLQNLKRRLQMLQQTLGDKQTPCLRLVVARGGGGSRRPCAAPHRGPGAGAGGVTEAAPVVAEAGSGAGGGGRSGGATDRSDSGGPLEGIPGRCRRRRGGRSGKAPFPGGVVGGVEGGVALAASRGRRGLAVAGVIGGVLVPGAGGAPCLERLLMAMALPTRSLAGSGLCLCRLDACSPWAAIAAAPGRPALFASPAEERLQLLLPQR